MVIKAILAKHYQENYWNRASNSSQPFVRIWRRSSSHYGTER